MKPLESFFLTRKPLSFAPSPPICCRTLLRSRALRLEPLSWSSCAAALVEPFAVSPPLSSHSATLPLPRAPLCSNCTVVCYQTLRAETLSDLPATRWSSCTLGPSVTSPMFDKASSSVAFGIQRG